MLTKPSKSLLNLEFPFSNLLRLTRESGNFAAFILPISLYIRLYRNLIKGKEVMQWFNLMEMVNSDFPPGAINQQ